MTWQRDNPNGSGDSGMDRSGQQYENDRARLTIISCSNAGPWNRLWGWLLSPDNSEGGHVDTNETIQTNESNI